MPLRAARLLASAALWALGAPRQPAVPAEVAAGLPGARVQGTAWPALHGHAGSTTRGCGRGQAPGQPEDWASAPLALEIQYARALEGAPDRRAFAGEMRRQGDIAPPRQRWLAAMKQPSPTWPRVTGSPRCTGPAWACSLFANGQLRGQTVDATCSRAFSASGWPRQTSEPALRTALLGREDPGERRWRRRRPGAVAGPRAWPTAAWACRWPSWRCRCTWCCPTTTPASSASRWPRLGALLLGARLLDAVADPLIGRWVDGWLRHSARRVLIVAVLAAVLLAWAFAGSSFPVCGADALLAWCAALLAVTYLSYSVLSGAAPGLGRAAGRRRRPARPHRVLARRPGAAGRAGGQRAAVGGRPVGDQRRVCLALSRRVALLGPARPHLGARPGAAPSLTRRCAPGLSPPAGGVPGQRRGQRGAGHAGAVLHPRPPAGAAFEPLFLASYFAAGALEHAAVGARRGAFWPGAQPGWPAWAWPCASFAWASALLGAGDVVAFTAVCVASGVALGADLALPGALLAGVIQRAGHGQQLEGAYFGWWNFCHQAQPGAGRRHWPCPCWGWPSATRPARATPRRLQALTLAYCLLPCLLKLLPRRFCWRLVAESAGDLKPAARP
jgi:GPH family glycoside/pentoside/hexuronide:cation symporter